MKTLLSLVIAASLATTAFAAKDAVVIGPFAKDNKCLEIRVPKDAVKPATERGSTATINRDALRNVEARIVKCPPADAKVTRVVPVRSN